MKQNTNILKIKWMRNLMQVFFKSFEKSRKRKRKFKDIDVKTEECLDPRETRMVVAFNLDLYDLVETFFFSR